MSSSVLIMMATFNSGCFLQKQIDSIIEQSYKNWKLFIQDDGSSDGTFEILKNYEKIDSRIKVFVNNNRHGPYRNFHSLINKCKEENFDYYMFSDHDDIWLPNKVQTFVDYQNDRNPSLPTLLYANMMLIDGNGKSQNQTIDDIFNIKSIKKVDSFFNHSIYGCNVFFNSSLFKIVPKIDPDSDIAEILCHDNLYVKYASLFGDLQYIDDILMKYRRYSSNVTSDHDYNYGFRKVISSISNVQRLCRAHARTYSQSLYMLNLVDEKKLALDSSKFVNDIKKALMKGGVFGVFIFIKYHVSCGLRIRTISRALLLLSGLYKKYLFI